MKRTDEMKKGWEVKRLGEVCEIKPPKKEARSKLNATDQVTFMPMENLGICEKSASSPHIRKLSEVEGSYTYFANEDVLLAKITPCFENGKLGIARNLKNGIGFGSSEYIVFRPRKELFNEFLFYFLSQEIFRLEGAKRMTGAVGHKRVPKDFIESLNIPLPPLSEQKRIVAVLDKAFAAIDKAKANAEKNLANAKELFESYLKSMFNDIYSENQKLTIAETAKVTSGHSFKSGEFKKQGKYQVIRMGNVRPGLIRESESPVFVNDIDEKTLSRARLCPNDVIITQTGTKKKRDYGFTAIIKKTDYLLNQRLASIRFSDNYLPKFFLYFSWTNIFKDQYFSNETGTVGQGNVGKGAITGTMIPKVSVTEQERFIKQFDTLSSESKKLEQNYNQKIAGLEELKKSILRKAFEGEV